MTSPQRTVLYRHRRRPCPLVLPNLIRDMSSFKVWLTHLKLTVIDVNPADARPVPPEHGILNGLPLNIRRHHQWHLQTPSENSSFQLVHQHSAHIVTANAFDSLLLLTLCALQYNHHHHHHYHYRALNNVNYYKVHRKCQKKEKQWYTQPNTHNFIHHQRQQK